MASSETQFLNQFGSVTTLTPSNSKAQSCRSGTGSAPCSIKPLYKAFIEQHRRSEVAIIKQGPAKRETGESGSCVPGSDVSGATALFNKGYFDCVSESPLSASPTMSADLRAASSSRGPELNAVVAARTQLVLALDLALAQGQLHLATCLRDVSPRRVSVSCPRHESADVHT